MTSTDDYLEQERICAANFQNALSKTDVEHVIYLSGITNENVLSKHLQSRSNVEHELKKGDFHLTTLRAGIIIGSGSASFEIIRDLVEKLPVMIAPKWLNTRCQSIGVSDVISFLSVALGNPNTYDRSFDIGGQDILSYKQMLLLFAKARGLKRVILTVPIMTPRLSSYWLYFVTSTSYMLASNLVESMKIEVVAKDNELEDILGIKPIGYLESLQKAFKKIESNEIVSSWKDATISSGFDADISEFIQVPTFGCYTDQREKTFTDRTACTNKIWSIGGQNGWYYANWLWRLRGVLDKLVGGVGLRRGRTNLSHINAGDALDFWRVLYANRAEGRLLLYAEMKVPGEAWLEFKIIDDQLIQTATFRPTGLLGRIYWYSVLPFHSLIFNGMINSICQADG